MRVYVESILPCSAELAWSAVQTRALLDEVIFPVIVLRPAQGRQLPDRWALGPKVRCRSYLFGLIPLGTRTLWFERIDQQHFEIQTREWDRLVRRWDHLVRIRPEGAESCCYSDEVEIEAGWRTPFVALFAWFFYRHRQRRWRRVARRVAEAEAGSREVD